jgi:hypothetical protein
MTRAAQDKPYLSAINGFITEATPLNFPENSLTDVSNCDIELKGSIRRRLGLNEEAGGFTVGNGLVAPTVFTAGTDGGPYSIPMPTTQTVPAEQLAITVHTWPNPGGQAGLYIVVFQIGNNLLFRNWDATAVSDPNGLTGQVVTAGVRIDIPMAFSNPGFVFKATVAQCAITPLQSSPGFGRLWMSSSAVFPFYLDFDPTTKIITANFVGYDAANPSYVHGRMDIRDFNGVPDGLAVDLEPATLSKEHEYNLINQGWDQKTTVPGNPGTVAYFQANNYSGNFPANNMQWFRGQDATTTPPGGFNPKIIENTSWGSTQAAKGAVVLNALIGSKDNPSHTSSIYPTLTFNGLYDEPSTTGFTTCAFYAGRVWFAGDSNTHRSNGVYFSKTLQTIRDSGVYMQVGDPTSQDNSDLLATDGGVIYIGAADRILKLLPFGAGMMVFAGNGVWFISGDGTGGGFTASNYTVQQISSTGLIGPNALSANDQAVFYFSQNSIAMLTLPQQGTIPIFSDIARTKIFTFYNSIFRDARANARAVFDEISKKLFFFYLDAPSYTYPSFQTAYNACLILDTRTNAYTKYNFDTTESTTNTLFTLSGGFTNRYPTVPQQVDVVVVGSSPVIVSDGDGVVAFEEPAATEEFINQIRVIATDRTTGGGCVQVLAFYDLGFTDFATMGVNAADYTSFLQTGPIDLGDVQRNKQATYVWSVFKRTETGFYEDTNGVLTPLRPSSVSVQFQWDWENTTTGHRWSIPQVGYRDRKPYVPTGPSDTYDTGAGVIYTKLKARGHGHALTVLYSSVSGYDFQLQGFSAAITATSV